MPPNTGPKVSSIDASDWFPVTLLHAPDWLVVFLLSLTLIRIGGDFMLTIGGFSEIRVRFVET